MKVSRILNRNNNKMSVEQNKFKRYNEIRKKLSEMSIEEINKSLEENKLSETDKTAYKHEVISRLKTK